MRSWTILIATLLVLAPLRGVGAFPPLLPSKKGLYPPSSSSSSRKEAPIVSPTLDDSGWSPAILSTQYKQSRGAATAAAVGFLSGSVLLTPYYALADTELEMADLPPPWIPVLFGIGLLAGVGLLTGSLGDVINEESLLGMQSGARAKKEIDRSRSSYFKKK